MGLGAHYEKVDWLVGAGLAYVVSGWETVLFKSHCFEDALSETLMELSVVGAIGGDVWLLLSSVDSQTFNGLISCADTAIRTA